MDLETERAAAVALMFLLTAAVRNTEQGAPAETSEGAIVFALQSSRGMGLQLEGLSFISTGVMAVSGSLKSSTALGS